MKYNGNILQDGIVVQFIHVDPANQHLPLLHIIKPGDQFNHGTLARAGLSHKCHAFPIPDLEVDALQDIRFPIVGKTHILKLNIMVFREVHSAFINRNVQYFFCFGNGTQDIRKVCPQFLQRPDLRQIHGADIDEQQKCTGRQGAFQKEHPAQGNHQQHPTFNQNHKGCIRRPHSPGGFIPHGILFLDRTGKFLERFAPHVVRFNQFHTADILDHNGIERCNGSVRPVHQIVRIPKHNPHYHNGQNQRHQGNQCQWDIYCHQINENCYRPYHIAHKVWKVMG